MRAQKPGFLPKDALYHVRSITRPQVGAREPTISANNRQSQKPARPGYYGQSIGHDITARRFSKNPGFEESECDRELFNKKTSYPNPQLL